jgi:hypothetical protein
MKQEARLYFTRNVDHKLGDSFMHILGLIGFKMEDIHYHNESGNTVKGEWDSYTMIFTKEDDDAKVS